MNLTTQLVGVLLGLLPSHVGHHKAEGQVLEEVSTRSQVYEVLFYQFCYISGSFRIRLTTGLSTLDSIYRDIEKSTF